MTGRVEAPRPVLTWPARVIGRVMDVERKPLTDASVVAAGKEIRVDAEGTFALEAPPPDTPLVVKLPGYGRGTGQPTHGTIEGVLDAQDVKGAHPPYYGVA